MKKVLFQLRQILLKKPVKILQKQERKSAGFYASKIAGKTDQKFFRIMGYFYFQ